MREDSSSSDELDLEDENQLDADALTLHEELGRGAFGVGMYLYYCFVNSFLLEYSDCLQTTATFLHSPFHVLKEVIIRYYQLLLFLVYVAFIGSHPRLV